MGLMLKVLHVGEVIRSSAAAARCLYPRLLLLTRTLVLGFCGLGDLEVLWF
jgi:hypothetical protein